MWVFMVYHHTKFHLPISNIVLVTAIKPNAIHTFAQSPSVYIPFHKIIPLNKL
jgi:hypothetical protein